MPNTREKLIELLAEFCQYKEKRCVGCDPGKHYHPECKSEQFGKIADHLIANGVTIAKDTNVPSKWIPVSERLPEEGKEVLTLCWHHESWQPHVCYLSINFKGRWITSIAGQWMMNVSHWMPLPQPPKEGE